MLPAQGSLVYGENHLFAVNAGSNSISVIAIEPRHLRFVENVSSVGAIGGGFPVSLAFFEKRLYVLNAGIPNNVNAYTFDPVHGHLTEIFDSNVACRERYDRGVCGRS